MQGKERKGLTREEYTEALDAIILKKVRGEKLDRREELIYAYRNVGRCSCGVRK